MEPTRGAEVALRVGSHSERSATDGTILEGETVVRRVGAARRKPPPDRSYTMTMIRRIFTVSLLALTGACLTEPEDISTPEERPGFFSITIQEFGSNPTSGEATFRLEPSSETDNFTLLLRGPNGTTIEISGPSSPASGVDFEIGEDEGDFRGTIRRPTAAGTEVYTLVSGSLSVNGVSARQVVGDVEFEAVQTQGPAPGAAVSGKGNFTATGGNIEK
jgi:hypothetical protein